MNNRDKIFRKRIVDLINWYSSEYKYPNKTSKEWLEDLKTKIKNSDCLTCNEEDTVSDEEEVPKRVKIYPKKYWKCEICNVSVGIYNKKHHLNTKKHHALETKKNITV